MTEVLGGLALVVVLVLVGIEANRSSGIRVRGFTPSDDPRPPQ